MLKHLLWIKGRANRTEFLFWQVVLGIIGFIVSLTPLGNPVNAKSFSPSGLFTAAVLLLPMTWVGLTLVVRRLHDLNLSGWWYVGWIIFLSLLTGMVGPLGSQTLNLIMIFVLLLTPGTPGPNRFGIYDKQYYPAFMRHQFLLILATILFCCSQGRIFLQTQSQLQQRGQVEAQTQSSISTQQSPF